MKKWGETPKSWVVYSGDSFRLEINQSQYALLTARRITAVNFKKKQDQPSINCFYIVNQMA